MLYAERQFVNGSGRVLFANLASCYANGGYLILKKNLCFSLLTYFYILKPSRRVIARAGTYYKKEKCRIKRPYMNERTVILF